MIAYIEGRLCETWNRACLLITDSGVGYEILLPSHTFANLPKPGERLGLFTSLVVREDALELFGFETFSERQTFNILTTISKVGARTALGILSILRPEELKQAVLDDNMAVLTKVSGIGVKTAQHIFLELKYKLASGHLNNIIPQSGNIPSGVYGETLAALLNLGYPEEECGPKIQEVLAAEPDLDVGSAIRLSLKAFAQRKIQ